jgi:hypothetical protein
VILGWSRVFKISPTHQSTSPALFPQRTLPTTQSGFQPDFSYFGGIKKSGKYFGSSKVLAHGAADLSNARLNYWSLNKQ